MTKYESFNIEPGQTSWPDMPEYYKKAYFAKKAAEPKKIKKKLIRSYNMPSSLDVFITGSSRPQLWPLFWESYKDMVKIRLPHEVTVHEDFVYPDQSNKVMISLGGGAIKRRFKIVPGLSVVKLPVGMTVEQALEKLNKTDGVLYAEPDYKVRALSTFPNDPNFDQLWGMHNTGQTGGTVDADIDAPP